jgi:hypothetical protein
MFEYGLDHPREIEMRMIGVERHAVLHTPDEG